MSDGQGLSPSTRQTHGYHTQKIGYHTQGTTTRRKPGSLRRPPGLSVCAHVRKSARTHARTHAHTRDVTGGSSASFPLRILARCDVCLSDERARAVSGGDAPRHRGSHVARAQVSAQERTPLLLSRMWVAALLSLARGSRDARAAMSMRARACLEAAPHAARNWGFVRLLLLSAWPDAPAVVFLAFLTRPTGGNTGERPPKSPRGHPSHQNPPPGIEARPRGLPPAATQPPRGGLGPKSSQ